MAVIDMPLEELMKYEGSSSCPDDIDEYWESALAEMKAVEPRVEIVPSDFSTSFADCFDLYFTGVGGARIHAKYLRPQNVLQPCPAIIEFHGYAGNAGDWYTKLGYVAEGFVVVAMDCRGQGGLSEDPGGVKGNTLLGHLVRGLDDKPQNLMCRNIFLDTAQLTAIVMEMPDVDESRLGVKGGSQGGGLALACAALEPRIKKLVSMYPFFCDYRRLWELDLETTGVDQLKEYFKLFDAFHEREKEIFEKLAYIDVQNLVKRITGQVLMAVTLRDDICPPSTQFAAYNNITSTKQIIIYHDYTHEYLPGMDDKAFQFFCDL
jgi:cephalosporin-C deacetylase